jgi:2-(acetamidomethylene)succinate hydrolase
MSAAEPRFRDRRIDVPGGQLHLAEWGSAGPVVLLTHGITAQAHVWDPIAARLSAGCHVLVLDALGAERAMVAGHSLGGRNAFAFAAVHPERVGLMVAVDYGPWIERAAFERVNQRVLGAPREIASEEEALAYLARRYPRITPEALRRRASYGLRRSGSHLTWTYCPDAVAQTLDRLDADLAVLVPRIQAPSLIIRGGDSDFYDAAAFARLQQARPDFEYVEVPGASHYVPEERPEEVAELLLSFIERRWSGPQPPT